MAEFVIARNPDTGSSLPYLVRLPLADGAVVLKVRDVWPRTAKVYCHRAPEWPDDPDIVERVPVRSCQRRGAAVDLVLDRGRENRSQFVFTKAKGRDVIFWQTARTSKQARPNVSVPAARAAGRTLEIVVDTHERYPWTFSHQQATTVRRALPMGDYAVEVDGRIVAAMAARFATVPIVFAETRQLAQEWTYRFLGAAVAHQHDEHGGAALQHAARRRSRADGAADHRRGARVGASPGHPRSTPWPSPPRDLGRVPRRHGRPARRTHIDVLVRFLAARSRES